MKIEIIKVICKGNKRTDKHFFYIKSSIKIYNKKRKMSKKGTYNSRIKKKT